MEKKLVLEFEDIKVYKFKGYSEDDYLVVDEAIHGAAKCEIKVLFANYLGANSIPYDVKITLKNIRIGNYYQLGENHFPFKKLKSIFLFLQTKDVIFVND